MAVNFGVMAINFGGMAVSFGITDIDSGTNVVLNFFWASIYTVGDHDECVTRSGT